MLNTRRILNFIIFLSGIAGVLASEPSFNARQEFDYLYASEGKLPEKEGAWPGKNILDSSCKLYNRMAFVTNNQIWILESGFMDSFFSAAKDDDSLNSEDFREGAVSRKNNDGIVTMLDLLFLKIDNRSTSKDLYNFQAAMRAACKKDDTDLNNSQNVYAKACKDFITNLELYLSYCPQIDMRPPRERHGFKNISLSYLTKVKEMLNSDNSTKKMDAIFALAYITHEYPVRCDKVIKLGDIRIEKTGKRSDNTSDEIKKVKRYLAAVSHTEVMYHVLKCHRIIDQNASSIIVSGKCPCPDCDVFIRNFSSPSPFSNCKMIGYAFGWAAENPQLEKISYGLYCKQLTPPRQQNEKSEEISNISHVYHIGNTPISGEGTDVNFQTFVIGPLYLNPFIDKNKCSIEGNNSTAKGPCIMRENTGKKQHSYQNIPIMFENLQ